MRKEYLREFKDEKDELSNLESSLKRETNENVQREIREKIKTQEGKLKIIDQKIKASDEQIETIRKEVDKIKKSASYK